VMRAAGAGPCTPPQPGLYFVLESRWDKQACFHEVQWQEVLRGGPRVGPQRWRRLVLARYGG